MFAIVDIEATGGSPRVARIMEIAVVVHNGERVIEEYSTLINPEKTIDSFVVALTGISNEMVENAPTFAHVAHKLYELTRDRIIVAHNARFDYSFLRHEFKRLGIHFQRRHLCTVKMSQKLLPGHSSYSLGNLCKDLAIPIKNRHRALGDAAATAVLLEKLLFSEKKQLVQELLKDELAEANLPANIRPEQINRLPEETGIYYFLDKNGKPLYIGKSKNIRQRVLTHFTNDLHSTRFRELKSKISEIDTQVTGSELIAELLEAGEIKRYMPAFNRAQRRKKYRYGIFSQTDEYGYKRLRTDLLHSDRKEVLKFTTKRMAEKALRELRQKNQWNQDQRMNKSADEYNAEMDEALDGFYFSQPNLFIIDIGNQWNEQSIIQIKNGEYVGYGYFSTEENDIVEPKELSQFIKKDYNSPDKERIIRKHLKRKNNFKLIPYNE